MTDRIQKAAVAVHSTSLYPEANLEITLDPFDLALPEPRMISKRLCQYILAQPVLTDDWQLFFGHFRFDGRLGVPSDLFPRTGHQWFSRACSAFYNKPIDRLITFEWQHSTPNSERIIKRGIRGCLEDIAASRLTHAGDENKLDYLDALEECCHGIIDWAHKCGDTCRKRAGETQDCKRRQELSEAGDILYRVPEYPAHTFREALQTIYLVFQFLSDSIGTIDRFLYPYYKRDLENGILTRDQAKEYLQSLFVMLQAHTDYRSANHNRGGECHFAVGGYLPNGEDGFSDLSYLIVESLMELPMNIPEISLRWTEKTPPEVLHYMLDCERKDVHKRIAFVSDEPRIRGFMHNLGMTFEQACNYTMVGCNEPAFQGCIWFGGSTINICRSLANLLHGDRAPLLACQDFDAFYRLYEQYLERDLDEFIRITDLFNAIRAKDCNVISSLFLDGCIENATPANRSGCSIKLGGAELMGITAVIDSLTVIRQFVFEEQTVSMNELLDALASNWESDPDLRTMILKKAKYFGNNEEISDEIGIRFTESLYRLTKDKRLRNGEHLLFGTLAGYNPHYATQGALTPATPDGRYDGEAFMVGMGQSFGRDREGLTALLSSVAKIQPSGILCGPFLVNVSLDEQLIRNDEYFEKTVHEIEAYFRQGGMHIQLNYVSREELLEARKTPEKYSNVKVRVSGYSDYFVNLLPSIQDNVIARTIKEC